MLALLCARNSLKIEKVYWVIVLIKGYHRHSSTPLIVVNEKKSILFLGATRSILKVGNKMFSLLRDINVLFLNNSLNPDFWLIEITPSNQNLEPKFNSQ